MHFPRQLLLYVSYYVFIVQHTCSSVGLKKSLILQLNGTKRTATTAGPPPAAVAERGKGGAGTGIDAAETAAGTVRTADTDAG